MTDQITLTDISVMPEVIPAARLLGYAVDSAEKQCGEAAMIVAEALRMYDAAIDDEKPYAVRNDLWGHYEFALEVLSKCKEQRDELKAALLANSN